MSSPTILYRPHEGWVGDVIPFYRDGTFWLYYLHDLRGQPGTEPGTSWNLVRTSDFVRFEECGVAVPHGGPADQDLHVYTGSVVESDGRFHIFYTGYNPAITDPADDVPIQVVMHAVSRDLVTWEKIPGDIVTPPPDRYESHDWRDPFVFHDPESGVWQMLLAARTLHGPSRRRGCIAALTSNDLTHWTATEPYWAPSLYFTHECPDLRRIGDWWYLVYSEFSERFTTRYRISRNPRGPWSAPVEDTLDSRALYAAKTASDGHRTYAFGWLATKAGKTDDGAWQWGGEMVVHELVADPVDGALGVRLPDTIRAAFDTEACATAGSSSWTAVTGAWQATPDRLSASARDSFASIVGQALPDRCLISATIRFDQTTRSCGLAINLGDDPDDAYFIRLEPGRDRVVFDRWPRRTPGDLQWHIAGDVPHAVELERAIPLGAEEPHSLDVLLDGSACIAYIDGRVAMSGRTYDRRQRRCGWFVSEGTAEISNITIKTVGAEPLAAQGGNR